MLLPNWWSRFLHWFGHVWTCLNRFSKWFACLNLAPNVTFGSSCRLDFELNFSQVQRSSGSKWGSELNYGTTTYIRKTQNVLIALNSHNTIKSDSLKMVKGCWVSCKGVQVCGMSVKCNDVYMGNTIESELADTKGSTATMVKIVMTPFPSYCILSYHYSRRSQWLSVLRSVKTLLSKFVGNNFNKQVHLYKGMIRISSNLHCWHSTDKMRWAEYWACCL